MKDHALMKRPLHEAVQQIADPDRIGGGGIAAALSGVLAISAAELVLRLARRRRSLREHHATIDAHLDALAGHSAALAAAADEEVEILARLLDLWSRREEPEHRAEFVAAVEAAIASPLAAAREIVAAANHIVDAHPFATSFTVSDMIAAVAMLDGAVRALVVTALVNVDLLADANPQADAPALRAALLGAQNAVGAAYLRAIAI